MINLKDIEKFLITETNKVLDEMFSADEKKHQEQLSSAIDKRGVKSSKNKKFESEKPQNESENEEESEKPKKKKSLSAIFDDLNISDDKSDKKNAEIKKSKISKLKSEDKEDSSGEEIKRKRLHDDKYDELDASLDDNEEEVDRRKFNTKGTSDSELFETFSEGDALKDPRFDDIKIAMDLFRGGKSTENPEIKPNLKNYIESMSLEERQAMYTLFMSAAEILSGRSDATTAVKPSDVGIRMSSDRRNDVQDEQVDSGDLIDNQEMPEKQQQRPNKPTKHKSVKPSKIKSKAKVSPSLPGTEDNPIVVGESSDKKFILEAIKTNKSH